MMHPVEKKLRSDILPNIVAVHRLRNIWYYKVYLFHIYMQDILAALAGVGLSANLLPKIDEAGTVKSSLSPTLTVVGIICAILWAYLKSFMIREEIEKKAVLIRSTRRQFYAFENEMNNILRNEEPMPLLNELYLKIQPVIDRNIQEGLTDLTDRINHDDTENLVAQKLNILLSRYKENWKEIKTPNLREL